MVYHPFITCGISPANKLFLLLFFSRSLRWLPLLRSRALQLAVLAGRRNLPWGPGDDGECWLEEEGLLMLQLGSRLSISYWTQASQTQTDWKRIYILDMYLKGASDKMGILWYLGAHDYCHTSVNNQLIPKKVHSRNTKFYLLTLYYIRYRERSIMQYYQFSSIFNFSRNLTLLLYHRDQKIQHKINW